MDPARLDDMLRRVRRADPDALAELVEAYAPRLMGLLLRLTGVREVAEDLVQETFLRAISSLGAYDDRGRFEAWLFRIAANLARDEARKNRRRGVPHSLAHGNTGDAGADVADRKRDLPHEALLREESVRRLEAGLARLSPADREVLLLRHYSGLSFREIAGLLGVPLGTALARAHRALAHLRRLVAEPGAERDGG
ncbi:MAG: sigma-70 family RNA polymerase sigma factor [Phycisphaerae bacterium]|nr:sigma-70 family RNA polymerase sigma factor [Phycisphaerae bacterium]MCZ2398931.1 sigma-70 family RNA polymerase sigma factor [Phycisphaerae bacterium]